jgi:hypothetical protein
MKKTTEQMKVEIESKMIEIHGRVYKYRLFQYRTEMGCIVSATATYIKGEIEVSADFTIQEVRDMKLQELGL